MPAAVPAGIVSLPEYPELQKNRALKEWEFTLISRNFRTIYERDFSDGSQPEYDHDNPDMVVHRSHSLMKPYSPNG